ncbi:hydrolase [Thermosulfurimonas marina]|uniref:Hydrolase n=1 Tax=Thermosulfurimonas marina TaxID=2047767 RepID=A0A6H1WRX1_9BACT|nr:hydrolase [Thermosulfurimonas marina]QJA05943.1 hydrolase [Thermosulfurimonas marina]
MFSRPQDCVLVLIDPQERLLGAVTGRERLVRNLVLLLRAARIFEVPVVATTQYRKGLGNYVPEVKELLEGLEPFDKMEFSVFKNPAIAERLRSLRRQTLVLCGAETHICVYQSALSALEEGFRVVVVGDATSSRTQENHLYGLGRMRDLGAAVVSTEMLIYEWLGKAGTPAFKELLPYLKD